MSRIAPVADANPVEFKFSTGRDALIADSLSLRGLLAGGKIDEAEYLLVFGFVFGGQQLDDANQAMRVESILAAAVLVDPVLSADQVTRLHDVEVGELFDVALRLLRDPFRRDRAVGDDGQGGGGGAQVGDAAKRAPRAGGGK